ncbi:hypothetical protein QQ054_34885 [Oscillatoria amoena NRMC-F 0135]|nr:hypothetical protein [Geitlerinema splendidum]MDL5051189.1 hypothetical protein [Oscillatoria amoena NRMC-F 0135]
MLLPLQSSMSCHNRISPLPQTRGETDSVVDISTRQARVAQDIEIDFATLQPFERVTTQYAALGAVFEQAIAIVPSNPIFRHAPDALVVMPLTHHKYLYIHLTPFRKKVEITVCGAKPVAMTAYDREGNILCHTCSLACSDRQPEAVLSSQHLAILATGIAKVMVHSQAPFSIERFGAGG